MKIIFPIDHPVIQTVRNIAVLDNNEKDSLCIRIANVQIDDTIVGYPVELLEKTVSSDGMTLLGADEIVNFPDNEKLEGQCICTYDMNAQEWTYHDILVVDGIYEGQHNKYYTNVPDEVRSVDNRYVDYLHELHDDGTITNRPQIIEFIAYNVSAFSSIASLHHSYEKYVDYLKDLACKYANKSIFDDFPKSYDQFNN